MSIIVSDVCTAILLVIVALVLIAEIGSGWLRKKIGNMRWDGELPGALLAASSSINVG